MIAQDKVQDDSYKPLKLNLNEDGSKYVRFIMWHQIWVTSNNLADESNFQLSTSIRRSRFLAYAQVSDDFLILTHWGLNGLNSSNLTSLGNNGDSPQLFLHGAWVEYKLNDYMYFGGGLHYWNGLTRLASQSTLNFLTIDQSRPFIHWHSLGITDQFARHLGVYLKGSAGKLEYRMAMNTPSKNPLASGMDYSGKTTLTYTGTCNPDNSGNEVGNMIFQAYVKYNLWDNESTKLPYYVGSYLGKKKVLAIGTGFYNHPNGMYDTELNVHSNVSHFALDAFMEYPTASGSWTVYTALMKFDYGEDYIGRWAGTGTTYYGQGGYYLNNLKIMPYLSYSLSDFDGASEKISALDIGINYYINGHNAKISAEYHRMNNDFREAAIDLNGGLDHLSQLRIQLQVFL